MSGSFTEKILSFGLSLGQGNFGAGGNSANLSGLRASATIIKIGNGQDSGTAQCAIYGLPLSTMNQLTTLGTSFNKRGQNSITIQAGDAESGMSTVFQGHIFDAYMDGRAQPQVCFRINATADIYQRVKPTEPTSVQGTSDVATTMKTIAGKMGLQFENNGVNVKLSNIYLPGAARLQAAMLAEHAGIQHIVDNGTLAIWNPGEARKGGAVMVSKETGMVAYPTFYSALLVVQKLFDPNIVCGGEIQVQSEITAACGTWLVNKTTYELEGNTPSGRWFQTMECVAKAQQAKTSSA